MRFSEFLLGLFRRFAQAAPDGDSGSGSGAYDAERAEIEATLRATFFYPLI